MDMVFADDFLFNVLMCHQGVSFFVANGLKGDVPVDLNGYLVMVNEVGDRVAFRAPGSDWEMDAKTITAYNPDIPSYVNVIRVPRLSLINE
ncbi:hypothetical protein ACX1JO_003834 [Cronobacter dublinensis]|nr:hypothetical protein [Cronobacter dublinensis]